MAGLARRKSWFREHSLSLLLTAMVLSLTVLYARSDSETRLGTFWGNAIADWLGVLAFVVATKYFFEAGSGESRRPSKHFHVRAGRFLLHHSLTLILAATGVAWVILYARIDPQSKWGAVTGNIVSDWTQVLGLVILTKYASERGSKEGH